MIDSTRWSSVPAHVTKTYGGINPYIIGKWVCQLHTLVAPPLENFPVALWTRGWMEPRAGIDTGEERNIWPLSGIDPTVARLPASVVLRQISNTRHSQKDYNFHPGGTGFEFWLSLTDIFLAAFISHCGNVYCIVLYCTSNEAMISASEILSNSLSANHSTVSRYSLRNW